MENQPDSKNDSRDLRQPVIDAARIPQERIKIMARPVLAAVRAAFEDPAVVAEYEQWKAERDARIQQK